MPMHDWTSVNSGLYHHFHQVWCCEISRVLNKGPLPDGYTALVEQRSGTKEPDILAIEERYPDFDGEGEGGVAVRAKPKTRHVRQSEKEYYVDKRQVTIEELEGELSKQQSSQTDLTVVLRLDRNLVVQDMVDLLAIGSKLKIKMLLATDKK